MTDKSPVFEIENLHASVAGIEILKGVDLAVYPGEVHALMGPNGSGKSTLANVLLGNPAYKVTSGSIKYKGNDITALAPDERARDGLFLGFQYPQEIPGVKVLNFMQTAMSRRKGFDLSLLEVRMGMIEAMQLLEMKQEFANRHLNTGYSGGEKKRNEILQMALLDPDVAILDETDSGLDIDALRIVSHGIEKIQTQRPEMASVIITHYQRILDYLRPDKVHVLVDGRIVASGDAELSERLDSQGFESFQTLDMK